jgi:hypothetical protein
VEGVDSDMAIAEVAVAAGFNVAVFFADFFLLEGAGMVEL